MCMSVTQQKLLILGSTGSIGTSTLNCVRRFPDRFSVAALSAGNNIDLLCSQVREFRPAFVSIANPEHRQRLAQEFGGAITIIDGGNALEALVHAADADIVVNALVGAVGLRPTIAALMRKKKVALANKESLVIGGDYIGTLLAAGNGELVPIDSEHSAILQCLAADRACTTVESIILTASGGPFRTLAKDKFADITPEAALRHPTWAMGKKITIDAATLMNKGFEVIEAHHLFKVSYDMLRVLIHPQSIIHSMVEFYDGAVLAQLGCPDMELPIQYALAYPERLPLAGKRLSLASVGKLDFEEPDYGRFPCLRLCIEAGRRGGTAPAVVNGANEVAVAAFLDGKIRFTDIAAIVETALEKHSVVAADGIATIEAADAAARLFASEFTNNKGIS